MQNNYNNMDIPYRMPTPLGFASSSSNIQGMNYPNNNQPHPSQSQGYAMNQMNSFNSPANMYSQLQGSGQQFGSNPMLFSNMNMGHIKTPAMPPQPMIPQPAAPIQPPQLVSLWNYLDNSNSVQGPFLATQMDHWLSSGFFKGDLRVCLVMSKPANPFDDPNVQLHYPFNVKANEYFTLQQFCTNANSDLKSPIFQNFDHLSSMILRDFFLKKIPSVMKPIPMAMPPMPAANQMKQPIVAPVVIAPETPAPSTAPSEVQSEPPAKTEELFETKSAISIESMKGILANNELKKNEYAESFTPPPERPKMSFREALALKPPKHPLAYTHKDKREIALPATKNILTRQGKYNKDYYIKANYNYEELINIGIKDEAGAECTYSEYISYLPVGKIEDFVIETDDWPQEFFETENNIENKLNVSYKKSTSLTNPEDIPEAEELRNYFAAVNDTTISMFNNTGGESHPLQVKDHVKILFERFTTAMNNNSLEIDGSILAYLSRVDNITLKGLVIAFRVIFESKVEKFNKSYNAVASSFAALFPKSAIIFNRSRSVYDIPFDGSTVTLLEFFIRSITLFSDISKDLFTKAIEIIQFLKKKNIKIKPYTFLDSFVKTNEYKAAEIDLLINEIDSDKGASSAKSANQAQLVGFLWSKVVLNAYDKQIRIHAYKFDNNGEDLEIFKDLDRDAPVFKWTTGIPQKKEVFEAPQLGFDIATEFLQPPSPEIKKVETKKEKSVPVEKKASTPVPSKEKSSTPSLTSKQSKKAASPAVEPAKPAKPAVSWGSERPKSKASSIQDIIQKKKEEDKKKAEQAKAESAAYEQPKNNIVEALKNIQKKDTKTVDKTKTATMPATYLSSSTQPKTNKALLEASQKKAKGKVAEPEFDPKFIAEQKKLFQEMEAKKKEQEASWVTVDKSKQQVKQKKVPVVSNAVPQANLNPDKLRKIQSQPLLRVLSSSKNSKSPSPKPNESATTIPRGSQKEFIAWCEKNLGEREFLKILFSIEKSNYEFFIDMVNSSGMNTQTVDKKVANEFFDVKGSFEKSPKFLFWNEAIDLVHQDDGGWSFQTVKKK